MADKNRSTSLNVLNFIALPNSFRVGAPAGGALGTTHVLGTRSSSSGGVGRAVTEPRPPQDTTHFCFPSRGPPHSRRPASPATPWGDQEETVITLQLGSPDGEVTCVRESLSPWKLAVEMDFLTKFSLKNQ